MSAISICLLWISSGVLVGAQSVETIVLREIEQRQYQSALARVEEALAGLEEEREPRERLEELRARCLYEMGDYGACESALKRMLERGLSSPARRRSAEIQLARVLDLEGAHGEAIALAEKVLARGASLEARRLIVRVLLERRRYAEARPHTEALLAIRPNDSLALFARGVAAAKSGDFRGAISDLRQSAQHVALRRNALFELALAYSKLDRPRAALVQLYAILAADPYDAEACHQAGRQLLRVRDRRGVRTAAQVLRYFETLKGVLGSSSLDHHFIAAGRPADAALERAGRWERVGDLERAVEAVRRAFVLRPGDASIAVRVADFWLRQGLLSEAEAALASLSSSPPRESPKVAAVGAVRERLALERAKLREERGALGQAKAHIASTRWDDARGALEELLGEARQRGAEPGLADRTARLLLARDPESVEALEHLIERTRAPELILPHLHYLGRLVRVEGAASRRRAELTRLERALLGEEAEE